jgi:DNA-binding CsgD family transcriptional regulator
MARLACVSREALRDLFGLTATEADLAARFAGRESLAGIAADRGRSMNTVRAQLKAIMAKTDTGRQAELMHLLAGVSQLRNGR